MSPLDQDISDESEVDTSQNCIRSSDPDDQHSELFTEEDVSSIQFDSESEGGQDDHENFDENFVNCETIESDSEDEVDNPESTSNFSDADQYIYPGAQITLATSMLLTVAFVCRHGISGQALLDLLTYVELHCMAGNLCAGSMKLLRQFFRRSRAPMECHFYCSNTMCKLYFGNDKDKVPSVCKACHSRQDKESPRYFLMNPLDLSLKNLFASKLKSLYFV